MKIALQIVFWILLLIGGAWVVSKVTYIRGFSEGDVDGPGYFSYSFRYYLTPYSDEPLDDALVGSVTIEGTAPGRLMLYGGKSPNYKEVSMEWFMDSGDPRGENVGSCTVNLSEKQIIAGADRLPLEQSSLRSLFGFEADSKRSSQFLGDLQSKLEAAASGTLPGPRHHTYYFEEPPAKGRLDHAVGGSYVVRFSVLVWAGIWLLLVLAAVVIKKTNPEDRAERRR